AWREERIDEMLFGGGEIHDGKSLVAAAEGGTIFLNHVELLSKEVQFKVYKLITGYSARVDELRVVPADVRVIASTGKNLRELVSTGSFREDLYYALSIISISVPSLRARREDITCMVKAWTNSFSEIYSKPVFLSGGVYDCICEYMWPGNDRQLRHLCQKIVLTTPHRSVSEAFVRSEIEKLARRELTAEMPVPPRQMQSEAARIITALENNHGNKTKTAEELGISKTTLWRKIQKYGITEGYH
ncbi:MAG: sigma-54-dependent Fis family transcriptional regulator, partial [Oscillospiraceae bacterium]|nr:sigma-54-dependent Fis family transcriptional regulator [Oscillospiraceae bacterium]